VPARGSTFRKTGKTKDRLFEIGHRQAVDGREWTFEAFKAWALANDWRPGAYCTRRDMTAPWSAQNAVLAGPSLRQISEGRALNSNNTTGIRGVSYHTRDKVFTAELCLDGKRVHRSRHSTLEDAVRARQAAQRRFHVPVLQEAGFA
jgi:hypothetical protein